MKALRIIAVVFALAMMLGEAYRTWGANRPVYAWLDDQILGAFLLLGAWLTKTPNGRNCAVFSTAWGFSAGMLYPSFFGKVFQPMQTQPGNFSLAVLTWLIGFAFATAIIGTILSIVAAEKSR